MAFLDQRSDKSGQKTASIMTSFQAPAFVKSASLDQIMGKEAKGSLDYADPYHKRYPITNPAAIWMSAAYFWLEKNADEEVERRIIEAAELFNIKDEVLQLKSEISKTLEKQAADEEVSDDYFALVKEVAGHKRRYYPLRNRQEVKVAAQYFNENRASIPRLEDRYQMANKILAAAEREGVYIGDELDALLKSACIGVPSFDGLCKVIRNRVNMAKVDGKYDLAIELEKLAKKVTHLEKTASLNIGEVQAVLELIDNLDNTNRWTRHYHLAGLPEDYIFTITEKSAEVVNIVVNPDTGAIYDAGAFKNLTPSSLVPSLGEDFVKLASDPDFDRFDQNRLQEALSNYGYGAVFDDVMASLGITPIMKVERGYKIPDYMWSRLANYGRPIAS